MSDLLQAVGRGAIAGAAGGALSAGVAFVIGEPSVDRAIALEEAAADHDGAEHAEVFTRVAQQGGLVVTAVLTGLAVGVIFGLVHALWLRRDPDHRATDPWRRAIRLSLMGFVGVAAIPFLRYPADPPAVGDPATVDARTTAYLSAVLIGLATVVGAWQVFARLARRGAAESTPRLAAAAVLVVGLAATWLLPADTDPIEAPAVLIWEFRVAALATLATLWLGLGATYGLLSERSESRSSRSVTTARR